MKNLEGKPFTLIGVNSDRDKETIENGLKEHKVTWRSFQNKRADKPDIAKDFNVKGWPTLYLIDHKGVIRKKWLGGPEEKVLDEEIDKLVKEAEADTKQG